MPLNPTAGDPTTRTGPDGLLCGYFAGLLHDMGFGAFVHAGDFFLRLVYDHADTEDDHYDCGDEVDSAQKAVAEFSREAVGAGA